MNHQLAALDESHDTAGFTCGEETLDSYLRNEALRAHVAGTSRTHVWADEQGRVIAYFTLMQTVIEPREMPKDQRSTTFPQGIPGYLIAKLARDGSLRGQGLGSSLLVDALGAIVRAADSVGGRLIVVDAIDNDAHAFYMRADFTPIDHSYRLWMPVATARATLSPCAETGALPLVSPERLD